MKLLSIIVYIFVQILFIPLAILGVIFITVKQFVVSKYLKISSTAVDAVSVRWAMDIFGIKEDEISRRLFKYLPNASLIGHWMVMYPTYLRYKISKQYNGFFSSKKAGKEFFGNPTTNRTLYFDKYIKTHQDSAKQLVNLAAGFDTRWYNELSSECPNLYEIDMPNTQRIKIETLNKANIDVSKVNFITADLRNDDWKDKLLESKFDSKIKTVFLMEGISVFLKEQDVLNILITISKFALKGSVVLVDFFSLHFVSLGRLPNKEEGYKFGINLQDSNNFEEYINKSNLELGRHNYLGQHRSNGPFMVTAELLVK
jgi:O-methyltransferase involved in polyketide biosynthesis